MEICMFSYVVQDHDLYIEVRAQNSRIVIAQNTLSTFIFLASVVVASVGLLVSRLRRISPLRALVYICWYYMYLYVYL